MKRLLAFTLLLSPALQAEENWFLNPDQQAAEAYKQVHYE